MNIREEILAVKAKLKDLEEKQIELFKKERDAILFKMAMSELDYNRKKAFIKFFYSEH